jgi:hypothetical protein
LGVACRAAAPALDRAVAGRYMADVVLGGEPPANPWYEA